MSDRPDPAVLLDAAEFAAEKHRDQRRKGVEASPYINHPIAVARVLASEVGLTDETLLVAALLHDTVEDTETTFDEIEAHFGASVRALVAEVTDDTSLPSRERKERQVQSASAASDAAKQLKIADKICNLRDIAERPPKNWPSGRKLRYLDWTRRVVTCCRSVNPKLERVYDETLERTRSVLGLLS